MKKYTFVIDIVTDSDVSLNVDLASAALLDSVDHIDGISAAHPVKVTELKEQGFKVWRARVAGITEESVNPKPVKAKAETEVAAS